MRDQTTQKVDGDRTREARDRSRALRAARRIKRETRS